MSCANSRRTSKASRTSWSITSATCVRCVTPPGQQIIERTRELEARLRRAELLTRSKDDFLANMSHEIRTPMNGVLGMAELLAGTDLDKRQRRFVDSMRSAAETMMQIINDILDDSKIEAGKMELVCEPFDVRELAEQAAQLYAGRAESKKIEMICRIEPTVPSPRGRRRAAPAPGARQPALECRQVHRAR